MLIDLEKEGQESTNKKFNLHQSVIRKEATIDQNCRCVISKRLKVYVTVIQQGITYVTTLSVVMDLYNNEIVVCFLKVMTLNWSQK